MATRYTLTVTFGGEENEAAENWHVYPIIQIAEMIDRGYTSGELPGFHNDQEVRIFWELNAEDD